MRYWVPCALVLVSALSTSLGDSRPPKSVAVHIYHDPVASGWARQYNTSYRVARLIVVYANKHHIPVKIAFKLVQAESRFDTTAKSTKSSATGLTQILVPTARRYHPNVTREDLLVPEFNLDVGFRFLQDMRKRYRGDWWRALVAYQEGPGVADTLEFGYRVYADNILY